VVAQEKGLNDRHFRYCVNRFRRLLASNIGGAVHFRVVSAVLNRLALMPGSTDVFISYLSLFKDDSDVQRAIYDFLNSRYNIYPWQEMLLLELLIRMDISEELKSEVNILARQVALKRDKHPACRARAYILWGKNGDYQDRRQIRSGFVDESHPEVRRAMVISIQEMNKAERDNFLRGLPDRGDIRLRMTTSYVMQLATPTYHYFEPPKGYDWDDMDDEDYVY
jgi:hypothetical protein